MLNYRYSLPLLYPHPLSPTKYNQYEADFPPIGVGVKNSTGVMCNYSFKKCHAAAERGMSENDNTPWNICE